MEAKGRKVDKLYGPPLPADAEHLWKWFRILSASRGTGSGFAPGSVGLPQIESFKRLWGIGDLMLWEIEALLALEQAWQAFAAEHTRRQRSKEET